MDGRSAGLGERRRTLGRVTAQMAPGERELLLASFDWERQANCREIDLKAGELWDKAIQLRMVIAGDKLAAVVAVGVACRKASMPRMARVFQVWTGQAEPAILMDESVCADVKLPERDEEAPQPAKPRKHLACPHLCLASLSWRDLMDAERRLPAEGWKKLFLANRGPWGTSGEHTCTQPKWNATRLHQGGGSGPEGKEEEWSG